MTIFDVKTGTVLKDVAEIIDWWYQNFNTNNYNLISENRNKLSALLVYLSEIYAREQVKSDYKYLDRKVKEAEIISEYKEKIEVKSFALAERLTDKDARFIKAFKEQKAIEANFERLKHLIRQSNSVLLAMHQSISILIKEKDNI